ncbi:cupin domain-containing protein [Demequina sp. B12]|uniref:cupin domain-containing protein n=1 Tax=Demequina sp. B12 TaxID=2992757 RepID=UPI00237AFE9B|nr:cupin domain-containing protein [Demequina sp. B12]MDE0573387.1 cupin domain-containing protein [Demequina sp. B12]
MSADVPTNRPSMLGASTSTDGAMTTVADLADLVTVQPESTVSRTVLKAEGSRIVLFAFDQGQVLTEHTAAMPVLLVVLEGRLAITADGRTDELLPGGVIHLTTRLPHAVEAREPSKLALIMLDPR